MVQLRGKVDPEKKTPWYAGMSLLDTEYESEQSLQLERPVQPELLLRHRRECFRLLRLLRPERRLWLPRRRPRLRSQRRPCFLRRRAGSAAAACSPAGGAGAPALPPVIARTPSWINSPANWLLFMLC